MAGTNPAKHLVKRYANRKLYDSTLRRFTTLDELAHFTGERHREILGIVKLIPVALGRERGERLAQ